MSFPNPALPLYGVWTQLSETAADLESRLNQRGFNVLDYVAPGYVQGTTDITAAAQACVNAAPDYSTIIYPAMGTAYKQTGVVNLANRNGLCFIGWGATIQLSGVGAQAFRFANSSICNDIAFYGFRVLGSGVVLDDHSGFGTIVGAGPNVSGTNIRFINLHVENCVRGIHMESSTTNWRDVGIIGCRFINIVGTGSGQGYGVAVASVLGVYGIGNYFDLCQRHSWYDANSQDSLILGNTFRRHRQGVASGAVVSALVISRRPNAKIIGNSFDTCSDCALSIESDESDVAQPQYNIIIQGNNFHDSVHWDVVIGSSAAATSGELSDVVLSGNVFTRTEVATAGIESVRVYNCNGLTMANNTWRMRNAYTVQKAAVVLGTAAVAASFLKDIKFFGNRCNITMNGPAAYFIEMTAPICGGTSTVVVDNTTLDIGAASGGLIVYDAALTNPNIRSSNNNVDDPQNYGGFRETLDGWTQDNVAANQAAVALVRWTSAGTGFSTRWLALRPGSVTGVAVRSSLPRTAGTLQATVYNNGASRFTTAILDGTNPSFKATTQSKGVITFVAGDLLDIRITTDAGWLPITAKITASIEVET